MAKPKIACVLNGPYCLLDEGRRRRCRFPPRLGRGLRHGARRRAVPLRRVGEQAVLRRHAQEDRLLRAPAPDPAEQARDLRRQGHHDPRQPRALRPCRPLHRRPAAVFRMRDEPWIDPDGAAVEEIVATIRKCPSGALSYSIDGVEPATGARADGRGDRRRAVRRHRRRRAAGPPIGEGASTEHYTLCRCGGSKNKPFCDGTHWDAGFNDPTYEHVGVVRRLVETDSHRAQRHQLARSRLRAHSTAAFDQLLPRAGPRSRSSTSVWSMITRESLPPCRSFAPGARRRARGRTRRDGRNARAGS